MPRTDTLLKYVTRGYDGQEVSFDVPVSVYPSDSGIVIINSPGASEAKDGRNNRWDTLAQHLQNQRVGTVVTYNPPLPDARSKYPDEPYSYRGASWNKLVVESLIHVVDYALEHAKSICGSSTPILYLAGFSAGGSACGAVAHLYPEVQRILLISAYDSVGDYFYDGIERFTGEIYMAYGAQDVMAGFLAYSMRFIAPRISLLRTQEIPDCDHGFTGATNSKILGNAFTWAFAGDKNFPAPDGGLTLYGD
jgi:pimeloyl-ACP methyl ester carboxylesterase